MKLSQDGRRALAQLVSFVTSLSFPTATYTLLLTVLLFVLGYLFYLLEQLTNKLVGLILTAGPARQDGTTTSQLRKAERRKATTKSHPAKWDSVKG